MVASPSKSIWVSKRTHFQLFRELSLQSFFAMTVLLHLLFASYQDKLIMKLTITLQLISTCQGPLIRYILQNLMSSMMQTTTDTSIS